MLRQFLRKIIPLHAILPLCLTGLTNLLAYQGAKLVQLLFGIENAVDITSAFDAATPFCPAWVLVYIAAYFFWIYQYVTVAKESLHLACRLAVADAVAKLICLIFFVAFPTTNVRPAVEGSGVVPFLMRAIYFLDTPTNLFPSIHCFVAWMGTRYLFSCKHLRHKALTCTLCLVGTLMVFASTLLTKQHVLIDVLGGIAVSEIGWLVARYTKLPQKLEPLAQTFPQTKLGKLL